MSFYKYLEEHGPLDISAETLPTRRRLFAAVTAQCEWCNARWPVVLRNGVYVHVGPFTEDPKLFSWKCAASSLRQGLDYKAYSGGPKFEWKLPLVRKLKERSRVFNPEHRSFWRCGIGCFDWPEWKRSIQVSDLPAKPKNITLENQKNRAELLIYDALDAHAREKCSQNQTFRPHLVACKGGGQRWAEPDCNGGVGCTTCWGVYQLHHDKWERDRPCDF